MKMGRFVFTNLLVLFLLLMLIKNGEMISLHGIGARVTGDRLLINETLTSPTSSTYPSNHTIEFQYKIDDIVSYIELSSKSNIKAQFVLNYDNILHGLITAIQALDFELTITIYGIKEGHTPPNFYPIFTFENRVEGFLIPFEDEDYEEDEFYNMKNLGDNILELGERQYDDSLIYKIEQYSEHSDNLQNHSVVFYFIDDYYLTYAEFFTIQTETASAEFSHVSDHSIKAIIRDTNVHSLNVLFRLYGFSPDNKPEEFKPLLPALLPTESPEVEPEEIIIECPTPEPPPPPVQCPFINKANTPMEHSFRGYGIFIPFIAGVLRKMF